MVGRGGRDRSSSAIEILTLNFFIHCQQHYDAGFGHKIRGAYSKTSSEFHTAEGTRQGASSQIQAIKASPGRQQLSPDCHTIPYCTSGDYDFCYYRRTKGCISDFHTCE
jgi:hypothetical protein